MAKILGWIAFCCVPAGFILALSTGDPKWFSTGPILTLIFAGLAIMQLEPND